MAHKVVQFIKGGIHFLPIWLWICDLVQGHILASAFLHGGDGKVASSPYQQLTQPPAHPEATSSLASAGPNRMLLGAYGKDEICDSLYTTTPVFLVAGEEEAEVRYELASNVVEDDEIYLLSYASKVFCRYRSYSM
jgi:hypothetical protein